MNNLLTSPILINAALFQTLWLACVMGSARGLLWPSLLAGSLLMIWQLHPNRRHSTDLKLLFFSIVLGLIIDTVWIQVGFLEFTDQRIFKSVTPLWILVLWAGFALTINHSLVWLRAHPLLPAVMGLIGGPTSYYTGLKLGAVKYLSDPILISACLGLAWAISMVIFARISNPAV